VVAGVESIQGNEQMSVLSSAVIARGSVTAFGILSRAKNRLCSSENDNNKVEAGQKSRATRQLRAGAVASYRSTCTATK